MDAIRTLFAAVPDARALGYGRSRFSFNVKGGRCERCEGQGRLRVTMALLPDTYVPCESCRGRRYNADTQAVLFKGKSVAEVLEMTIDEARAHLSAVGRDPPAARLPLRDRPRLPRPRPALAHALRRRGAAHQARRRARPRRASARRSTCSTSRRPASTWPTWRSSSTALQRLVDRGDTVVVIEHNLDLIAAADCVIDLGPEGGEKGGRVVAWGTPEQVARVEGLPHRALPARAPRRAGPGGAASLRAGAPGVYWRYEVRQNWPTSRRALPVHRRGAGGERDPRPGSRPPGGPDPSPPGRRRLRSAGSARRAAPRPRAARPLSAARERPQVPGRQSSRTRNAREESTA